MRRQLRQAVGTEASFLRTYGPRFRLILEAVSEEVYASRGVSESEMAVTLHKCGCVGSNLLTSVWPDLVCVSNISPSPKNKAR